MTTRGKHPFDWRDALMAGGAAAIMVVAAVTFVVGIACWLERIGF